MLGHIATFCHFISRSLIVKNSTSISSVWQTIRTHYAFQSTGAHFLDFSNIKLEVDERLKDLFQCLMSFTEVNLLLANDAITHQGENVTSDEELTPNLENMVVLTPLTRNFAGFGFASPGYSQHRRHQSPPHHCVEVSPAHFVKCPVAMTNTSSALVSIYLLRIVLTCLGLA